MTTPEDEIMLRRISLQSVRVVPQKSPQNGPCGGTRLCWHWGSMAAEQRAHAPYRPCGCLPVWMG
ncbi:MAG: hypothetical protein H7839_21720 [Magnetococcus sp. YQC-5]